MPSPAAAESAQDQRRGRVAGALSGHRGSGSEDLGRCGRVGESVEQLRQRSALEGRERCLPAVARRHRSATVAGGDAWPQRRASAPQRGDRLSGGSADGRGDRRRDAQGAIRSARDQAPRADRCAVARRATNPGGAVVDRVRSRSATRRDSRAQGKGNKRREVEMDSSAWSDHLAPWLACRAELPVGSLFCVVDGPTRSPPWSATAVRGELRRYALAAGVRRRFAPHRYADRLVEPTLPRKCAQIRVIVGRGRHKTSGCDHEACPLRGTVFARAGSDVTVIAL